jgi:phage FluMu gp28-like protein
MSSPFVLLPYQQRWVGDDSPVQVAEKSRRIGVTWASALRAVLESGTEGGWDTFYTGYRQELAEEFIREAAVFAEAIHAGLQGDGKVETFLFDDVDSQGEPKGILAYQIRFASGKRIVALSSSPRNLRGIQGRIIIDEFAFHDNPDQLLKAAMATLMWGGKVSIISTHNGEENAFNKLIQDINAGRFAYSLHRTTLDDALAQGLYQRIALVTGQPDTPEAQQAWRDGIVNRYGDHADEELFCIPRRSGGVYLPAMLIEACMNPAYKVIRLKLDDKFALLSEPDQQLEIRPWLDGIVTPAVKSMLDHTRPMFVGEDFGRRSDITAIALGQEQQDLTFAVPLLFELRNVPFEVQKTIFLHVLQQGPTAGRIAVDSSGNGMFLGESVANHYGNDVVHRIGINVKWGSEGHEETRSLPWPKWYAENLPKFKAAFEDQAISIPKDLDIRNDLTAFQVINGIPVLPKLRAEQQGPDRVATDYRHGDAGVALALCEYAKRVGAWSISSTGHVPRGGDFHQELKSLRHGFRRGGML